MSFDGILTRQQREQREAARQRMGKLEQTMREVRAALDHELSQAVAADPRSASGERLYSDAGLRQYRAERAAKVREKAAPQLAELRDRVERDARLLAEHAESMHPRIGDDAASQMRAQRKWDQARMMLDAGMPMRTLVQRTDDVETLLAIAEWAPSYLDAQQYRAPRLGEVTAPSDHGPLQRGITARVAELSGGETRDALVSASEARAALAGFAHRADYLDSLVADDARVSPLEASIRANVAEQLASSELEGETASEVA